MSASPRVCILGGANVDYSVAVNRLPEAGETMDDGVFAQHFGGKGANQAVACVRAGASTALVSCLGDDAAGHAYRQQLEREGVETSMLEITGTATGCALIMVDRGGQNAIAVAPGANNRLSPEHVSRVTSRLSRDTWRAATGEVKPMLLKSWMDAAADSGAPVLLNFAPASGPPPDLSRGIEHLVVNETEAGQLLGRARVHHDAAADAAIDLCAFGPRCVTITLGAHGVVCAGPDGVVRLRAPSVEAIDATAAGDTFCGYLAAALASGDPLRAALERATLAASFSTTRRGAQDSIPHREEVTRRLAEWR